MKEKIVRKILEELPDWFAMEEGREQYIRESAEQICIGAANDTEYVGFLCLKETGKATLELAVMGVLSEKWFEIALHKDESWNEMIEYGVNHANVERRFLESVPLHI